MPCAAQREFNEMVNDTAWLALGDVPLINTAVIHEIRRVEGGVELFLQLVELFEQEAPRQFASLVDAWQRQENLSDLSRQAHRLKGSARSLGAQRLASCCGHVEEATRAGDFVCDHRFGDIDRVLNETMARMRAMV